MDTLFFKHIMHCMWEVVLMFIFVLSMTKSKPPRWFSSYIRLYSVCSSLKKYQMFAFWEDQIA